MKQIVTAEQYRKYKAADDVSDEALERVLDIAQQVVDEAACGRLKSFDSFPDDIQERIVKAICAQTDFILTNFGTDISDAAPMSASIGSFSYTMSDKSKDISPTTLNYVARLYLQTTGLLYRGDVDVC